MSGECRGTGECECAHCNEVRADERKRIAKRARDLASMVRGSGEAPDRYADALVIFASGLEANK